MEHAFGHMTTAMGGDLVRANGLVRARMQIGMRNLTYDMGRLICGASPALSG
jgi:hypothetical protein